MNTDEILEEDEQMSELAAVAFAVVMNAGDAKLSASAALKKLHEFDFDAADKLMDEAYEHLCAAHNAQTDVIQSEAAGKKYENSLLFNHAQDTLMTAMTQCDLSKEIIALFKLLHGQIHGQSNEA